MKTKIKKGIITVLTFALLLSIHPVHVFAADETGTVKISTVGANAGQSYTPDDEYAVMSIEIQWADSQFTYYFGEIWDAENHCYLPAEGKEIGWNKTSTSVSVKNHSNIELDVEVEFEKNDNEAFKSVSASFDKTTAHLESAVGRALDDTPTATFTLTIDGVPDAVSREFSSLGTVTVYVGGVVADVMTINVE